MLCQFLMAKEGLKMLSSRKTGSKTVLLTTLVSMMMIGTSTALPDEGEDIEQG